MASESENKSDTSIDSNRGNSRYLGLGMRTSTWMNSANISLSSSSGFGNMVEHDTNFHTIVDFTMALGSNYLVGLIVDLDDKTDRLRRFAVRAGYGDWQIYLERGRISGTLNPDYGELTLQPAGSGLFDGNYTYSALYKDRITGYGRGIAYIEWEMPTYITMTTTPGNRIRFIDPSTLYQSLGIYMNKDPLKEAVEFNSTGFKLGLMYNIGISRVSPSDEDLNYLTMLSNGEEINNSPEWGIATFGTFRLGYYGNLGSVGSRKFVYGIGYEINQFTSFGSGIAKWFTEEEIDPYTYDFGDISSTMNMGPYIHIMGAW